MAGTRVVLRVGALERVIPEAFEDLDAPVGLELLDEGDHRATADQRNLDGFRWCVHGLGLPALDLGVPIVPTDPGLGPHVGG